MVVTAWVVDAVENKRSSIAEKWGGITSSEVFGMV
jgi:hypothetical protein